MGLELAFAMLMLIDYWQTRDIKNHPGYYETNPLLGKHPSDARIRNYFIGATVAHAAITYALPEKYRPAWQWGTIGVEAAVVLHNKGIGLKIAF